MWHHRDESGPAARQAADQASTGYHTVRHPLELSRYTDRRDEQLALRQATDELMREIGQLSGQDYVDEDAAKLKSGDAAIVA